MNLLKDLVPVPFSPVPAGRFEYGFIQKINVIKQPLLLYETTLLETAPLQCITAAEPTLLYTQIHSTNTK